MPDRTDYRVQKRTLTDESSDDWLRNCTAAERICMVWPLTMNAWAFSGEIDSESRLQRHVVRTKRTKS